MSPAESRLSAVRIIGILNLTRDSYSDGGRYLDPAAAIGHARQMLRDGAAWIDVGAESSHPDSESVTAEAEFARLAPVIAALKADGATVSVDTTKPAVMRHVLALGADALNDIRGFAEPDCVTAVRDADAALICMFNRTATDDSGRARRGTDEAGPDAPGIPAEVVHYFSASITRLTAAGVRRERLILDPGMGFFLGPDPRLSLRVLRDLDAIKALGLPICVSPSRKSFIGAVLSDERGPRAVAERGAGTLAAELWAATHGAAYIRTHDVRALRDALRIHAAIETA